MSLSEKLIKKLACPVCRQPLIYAETTDMLECKQCRVGYRSENDVPALLVDQAHALEHRCN